MIKQIIDYGNSLSDPLNRATQISTLSRLGAEHGVLLSNPIFIDKDDPILKETARLLAKQLGEREFSLVLVGYHNAIITVEI